MKLFVDTANVNEIVELNEMRVICDIAKEGRCLIGAIKQIASIVDDHINREVLSDDAQGMIKEGIEIFKKD